MRILLFDANVPIDYFGAEPTVFATMRKSVGDVYVLRRVLDEVDQLDDLQASELGLQIFEPSFEQFAHAAAQGGRLSFQDHPRLAVAKAEGKICVANDIAPRTRCTEETVETLWALELLIVVVEQGGLLASHAADIGRTICGMNPRLGKDILRAFLKKVRKGGW